MAADYTFDVGIVFDDATLQPAQNASGQLLNVAGGTAQQVYNLQGSPIPNLTSNQYGYITRFKAGVPFGVVTFGSVVQPVVSIEALESGPAAAAAATSAAQAAAAASSANTAAVSAQQMAQNAANQVAAYISGGGGGGGGLPAGTDLDDIPNGSTRFALTQAQIDKLTNTPTTFLQLGTTASTAKAGNYQPTPAQIGAVQSMSGPVRQWYRSAAQGFPQTADGAQDGDWLTIEAG